MTKQEIINAAFKVWGRELYQSTSLAQLARELGVSKPALYRHFKNKQALLDGMYTSFFDECAAFIKPQYDRALKVQDPMEKLFIILRSNVEYYIRHKEAFLFSLVRVYGCQSIGDMIHQFRARGIDLSQTWSFDKEISQYPPLFELIGGALSFILGYFHKSAEDTSDPEVAALLASMEEKISQGLGLQKDLIDALDYAKLEALVARRTYEDRDEQGLLKAVACAVAEAGPWNASMNMVAGRSGLSKSSLYSHFKNKRDMLRQLYITEFDRILGFAEEGITWSEVPEEQLYLAIFSVADYLRSRSEILLAADWIRSQRLDLGIKVPPRLYQVFADIKLKVPGTEQDAITPAMVDQTGLLILFLIVHTLMRRPKEMPFSALPNSSIQRLFQFITLGVTRMHTGGFGGLHQPPK